MLQNLFSIRQFRLSKWSFLVQCNLHSTTLNAPYIHPSHDSILELWRTFPNAICCVMNNVLNVSIKNQVIEFIYSLKEIHLHRAKAN